MLRLLCRVIARATDSGDGPAQRTVNKIIQNQLPVDMEFVDMGMRGTSSSFVAGRECNSCFDKKRAGVGATDENGITLVQTRSTFEFKQRNGAARCEFWENVPGAN